MSEEQIVQHVDVSDHAQVGDITLIGKIVYVIKNPSRWQEALWGFVTNHRYFLAVLVVLQTGLAVAYLRFKNLYLISWGWWALCVALLAAAAWGWYTWGRSHWRARRFLFPAVATVLMGSLVGWQTWQAANPSRFGQEVFGIGLAHLGEGPNYRLTSTSRQLTDQVYEFLLQTVKRGDEAKSGAVLAAGPELDKTVAVRRMGVIPDSETARAFGQQIGAEIVIWGQVVAPEPRLTTIRFYVLETFDRADDPEFPFVMPVTGKTTDVSVSELDLETDPVKIKKTVAVQSQLISSYILGLIDYLNQDFAAAVPELTSAIELAEGDPSMQTSKEGLALLYYYLGTATHRLGRFEEGQELLMKGMDLSPVEPAFPVSLAFGYKHLGMQAEFEKHLDLSFQLLNRWQESHPDDVTAMYDRGMAYYLRDDPDLERREYERIIAKVPEFYVAYINLGRDYSKLGRHTEAQQILKQAIALAEERTTNSGMAWLQLALAREQAGDVEGARQAYLEANERLPQVYWPHLYYAKYLEKQNELDGAMLAYERMVETAMDKALAYRTAGDFARRVHRLPEAVVFYQQAVDASPDAAVVRTFLAETYYELGEVDKAWVQFEQAVDSGSGSYYPYASYGWRLYQEGEFEKAAEMYNLALEWRPEGAAELFTLARIYLRLGDCEGALGAYSALLALEEPAPDDMIEEAEANVDGLKAQCDESVG